MWEPEASIQSFHLYLGLPQFLLQAGCAWNTHLASYQMPKPPQLAPFNAKVYPSWMTSHLAYRRHQLHYPQSRSFGHDPSFMTIVKVTLANRMRDLPSGLALFTSNWCSKASAKLLLLLWFFSHLCSIAPSLMNKTLTYSNSFISSYHHPYWFTLCYELIDWVLKVIDQWCYQDHIVCKKEQCRNHPTPTTMPQDLVQENRKQYWWQGAALAEANPHWERVRLTAEKRNAELRNVMPGNTWESLLKLLPPWPHPGYAFDTG